MRGVGLLALGLVCAASLGAQTPEPRSETPWRTSYFPYLTGGTNDGPVLAFRVRHWQPAEYEDRVTANAASTSTPGSPPAAAGISSPNSRLRN